MKILHRNKWRLTAMFWSIGFMRVIDLVLGVLALVWAAGPIRHPDAWALDIGGAAMFALASILAGFIADDLRDRYKWAARRIYWH